MPRIVRSTVLLAALCTSGCVAPVASIHERTCLGLFAMDRRHLAPGVNTERATGIGVWFGRTGVGLGYGDFQALVVVPDVKGHRITAHDWEIATGQQAEVAAREDTATLGTALGD